MKILELEIEGFRSLKKVVWKPGDLNVIVGRNGSGKSNLLRALELISASAQGKLADYISAAGGMKALVWNGEADKIYFKLTTTAEFSTTEADTAKSSFMYAFVLARVGNDSDYRLEKEILEHFKNNDVARASSKLLQREEDYAAIFNQNQEPLQLNAQLSKGKETLLSFVATSFKNEHYSMLLAFAEELARWCVYPTLKTTCPIIDQVSLSHFPFWYDNSEFIGDFDFKAQVDAAMRAAFGNDFDSLEFLVDEQGHFSNWGIRWKSSYHLNDAAFLSDGALRYLFLLSLFLTLKLPTLIAIDEPETGLHHYTAAIVAELASNATRHSPVFFTTNSPEFLSAFARDSIPTVTVSSWFNGETKLQVLDGEELQYWLKAYSLGSLYVSGHLENMALDDGEEIE